MNESENKVNLAEIARLHAVNNRLRAETERWRAKAFNPVTLTDAEREAVHQAAIRVEALCQRGSKHMAATLRGLLERTRPPS